MCMLLAAEGLGRDETSQKLRCVWHADHLRALCEAAGVSAKPKRLLVLLSAGIATSARCCLKLHPPCWGTPQGTLVS